MFVFGPSDDSSRSGCFASIRRAHPVALTADIEKAFLNISVDPDHRDYLRFQTLDSVHVDDFVGGGDDGISTYKLHKNVVMLNGGRL